MKILHLFKFVFYTYILRPHTRGRRIYCIYYWKIQIRSSVELRVSLQPHTKRQGGINKRKKLTLKVIKIPVFKIFNTLE